MNAQMRKQLHEYKAYILDMDGTLYAQLPVRLYMALSLCVHYFIRPRRLKELFALKEFRKLRENNSFIERDNFEEQQYRHIAERYGMDFHAVKSVITYWMAERPLKYIRRFKNKKLISEIEALRKNGALVAVYSDYPVSDKLNAIEFEADYAFHSQDQMIMCLKPCGKGLVNIIKLIGQPVDDILYIGDRYEKDGLCAKSVGMDYLILGSR